MRSDCEDEVPVHDSNPSRLAKAKGKRIKNSQRRDGNMEKNHSSSATNPQRALQEGDPHIPPNILEMFL